MKQNITIPQEEIAAFCRKHHIRKLSLFGSVLRDDFRADSDIDVLVEFESGQKISLFDLGRMQMELSDILGRFVDLKTPNWLSRYFRQRVLDTAQVQYERT